MHQRRDHKDPAAVVGRPEPGSPQPRLTACATGEMVRVAVVTTVGSGLNGPVTLLGNGATGADVPRLDRVEHGTDADHHEFADVLSLAD